MFSNHYSTHIDSVLLASRVPSAKGFVEQKVPVFAMYNFLNTLPFAFSGVLKMLRILLAIPVTTAGNERFFLF